MDELKTIWTFRRFHQKVGNLAGCLLCGMNRIFLRYSQEIILQSVTLWHEWASQCTSINVVFESTRQTTHIKQTASNNRETQRMFIRCKTNVWPMYFRCINWSVTLFPQAPSCRRLKALPATEYITTETRGHYLKISVINPTWLESLHRHVVQQYKEHINVLVSGTSQ